MPKIFLPPALIALADHLLQHLRAASGAALADWNGARLLGERAKLMQFAPTPLVSANGSCHLICCENNRWIALNLARATDWDLLPALFQGNVAINTTETLRELAARQPAQALVEQGRLLGLAIALVPEQNTVAAAATMDPVRLLKQGKTSAPRTPSVLDLSSLWAGPLCSQLLLQCGAAVTTVESQHRPDGARLNPHPGAQQFYERLHCGKQHIILDFSSAADLQHLKQLIANADIVIEASRPRALQQLGIIAEDVIRQSSHKIWVSITGYGRALPQGNWIAYGDDAAAAAGLVQWKYNAPQFIGDAIADPLTGAQAALAAWQCWTRGESALLDISLYAAAGRATLHFQEH